MLIVTACSSGWYPRLISLIGSLHHTNYDLVEEIRVYDLGLTPREHDRVAGLDKVVFREAPLVNPWMLTPLQARVLGEPYNYVGLMTWKPAILKHVLQDSECALWLDSGVTAWGPLGPLWEHVRERGHFFVGCGTVRQCCTEAVRARLGVTAGTLDSPGVNAGLFGFSRRVAAAVVDPLYEWARDISLFVDDGSAAGGPTAARHEQTLLGILLARAGLGEPEASDFTLAGGERVRITCSPGELDDRTILYHSRGDGRFGGPDFLRERG